MIWSLVTSDIYNLWYGRWKISFPFCRYRFLSGKILQIESLVLLSVGLVRKYQTFSVGIMHFNMSFAKWRLLQSCLNVLTSKSRIEERRRPFWMTVNLSTKDRSVVSGPCAVFVTAVRDWAIPLLRLLSWYSLKLSSRCKSFKNWTPVDEIYGCPNLTWVAVIWPIDRAPGALLTNMD